MCFKRLQFSKAKKGALNGQKTNPTLTVLSIWDTGVLIFKQTRKRDDRMDFQIINALANCLEIGP